MSSSFLLLHYQLGLYSAAFLMFIVGFWIYLKKRTDPVAQQHCLYSTLIAFWACCQAFAGTTANPNLSLWFMRIAHYAIAFFPYLLLRFLMSLARIDSGHRTQLMFLIVPLCFVPWIHTPYFLTSPHPAAFLPYFPRPGPIYIAFNLLWIIGIVIAILPLVFDHSDPNKRGRNRFLIVNYLIGYLCGVPNFLYVYNVYIPYVHPFASYGIGITQLVIAYGVFSYGLFDINVVIRKSVVYSLLASLLTLGYFMAAFIGERYFQSALRYQSLIFSLAMFGVVALLFQPVKFWLERQIDRWFLTEPKEALAKRLEQLDEDIRETDKAKAINRLAGGIAHELRNPLCSIKAFVSYLPKRHDDPKFMDQFQSVVNSELDRLQGISEGLIHLSKPTAKKPEQIDLTSLIAHATSLVSAELSQKGIRSSMHLNHNGAVLLGDSAQLAQVFLNLVLNAKDAMQKGGVLIIRTTSEETHVVVEVTDTGCGIPQENLPRVFDPFFSAKPEGTGLGLYNVQRIISDHKGTISAQSAVGQGTTFTIQLPVQVGM